MIQLRGKLCTICSRNVNKQKISDPQNGNQKSVQLPSQFRSFIISLYFATLLSSTFRSLLLFAKNLLTEKKKLFSLIFQDVWLDSATEQKAEHQ